MIRHPLTLTALLGAALLLPVAALLSASPGTPPCHLQVIPDYTFAVTYKAVLRPSSGCPYGTVLRTRKSSTTSVKRNGAPWQPIKPEVGAWEVGTSGALLKTPVPARELWTLYTWRWEWFDAQAWNTRTHTKGRWTAGEVLRAAP